MSNIVARVNGGLGNQFFQYAMARALALRHDAELHLDLRFFNRDGEHTARPFELALTNARFRIADAAMLERFSPEPATGAIARAARRVRQSLSSIQQVRERSFAFDPSATRIKGDTYVDGHWQSEKYFADHEAAIRAELSFKGPLSMRSSELERAIRNEDCAVSVHVRRGDYVSQAAANAYHGTCEPAYYQQAMETLAQYHRASRYYVFSDDPAWARANVQFDAPVEFVDHNNGADSWQDLQLMSRCRQHVIANSSFSWWGAWLNPARDKRVVAPRRWFRDPAIDTHDLIPASWSRI